jgi:hypothetical protein
LIRRKLAESRKVEAEKRAVKAAASERVASKATLFVEITRQYVHCRTIRLRSAPDKDCGMQSFVARRAAVYVGGKVSKTGNLLSCPPQCRRERAGSWPCLTTLEGGILMKFLATAAVAAGYGVPLRRLQLL